MLSIGLLVFANEDYTVRETRRYGYFHRNLGKYPEKWLNSSKNWVWVLEVFLESSLTFQNRIIRSKVTLFDHFLIQ